MKGQTRETPAYAAVSVLAAHVLHFYFCETVTSHYKPPMVHQLWSRLGLGEVQPLGSLLCCVVYQNKADIALRGAGALLIWTIHFGCCIGDGDQRQLMFQLPSKNFRQAAQCFLGMQNKLSTQWSILLQHKFSVYIQHDFHFYLVNVPPSISCKPQWPILLQHKFSVLYTQRLPFLSDECSIFYKLQT